MNDAVANTTFILLQTLGVPVTRTSVRSSLYSHPDFPSLYSISDYLQRIGVDTMALQVDLAQLSQIPCPFLAHTRTDEEPFWIVTAMREGMVSYIDKRGRNHNSPLQQFTDSWDGTILAVEKGPDSGEQDYAGNRKKEWWTRSRMPLLLIGFLVLSSLGLIASLISENAGGRIYLMTQYPAHIAGMLISIFLLWYEYDRQNPMLKRVCGIHSKTDCSAVLGSRASKLFGIISWAEMGFIYFTGGILYMAMGGRPLLLAGFNALSACYILFSIGYQALVVGKWCMLCLLVQLILAIEFGAALLTGQYAGEWMAGLQNFGGSAWVKVLEAWFIPLAGWMIFKPFWYAARDGEAAGQRLARLKSRDIVWRRILAEEPVLGCRPEGIALSLGNPTAGNEILIVSGPQCAGCAIEYRKLEPLLEKGRWRVSIILSFPPEDMDALRMAEHFTALSTRVDSAMLQQELSAWYRSVERGRDKGLLLHMAKPEAMSRRVQAMQQWCLREQIDHTPAVFVDGHRLPALYDIQDLQFIQ